MGYAPGSYQIRCSDCGELRVADKRATTCWECHNRWVRRLVVALQEIEELALWHCDEDARLLDTDPEDQVAHINGLIVREARKALPQHFRLPAKEQRQP